MDSDEDDYTPLADPKDMVASPGKDDEGFAPVDLGGENEAPSRKEGEDGGPGTDPKRDSVALVEDGGTGHKIAVAVKNPIITDDKIVMYTVTARTSYPAYERKLEKPGEGVQRRFRDFLALYERLENAYPAVIMPCQPQKHALVNRYGVGFVESRRQELDRFLRRCARHPVLKGSNELRVFLTAKDAAELGTPQNKREDIAKAFANVGLAWRKVTRVVRRKLAPAPPEEWSITALAELAALKKALSELLRIVERLGESRKDMGSAASEFGLAAILVSNTSVHPSLSKGLQNLGNTAEKWQEKLLQHAEAESILFRQIVSDYLQLVENSTVAVNRYLEVSAEHASEEKTVEKKKVKAEGTDEEGKANDALEKAQSAEANLGRQVADMRATVRSELERFSDELLEDFSKALTSFVRAQIEFAEKGAATWGSVLPAMEAIEDSFAGDKQ